ncbi:KTI12 [Cordylochernes scorpioides]|uniref:Protein KTI12 homolog n=1 Tax=Cordylochernes scorpioides TaxID=51811 RepID=A0ABY6KK31_9ARAC|nr:KTI12 [Cordylochernes scorpioides]
MPLLTITGFPKSGKTTIARQLEEYLKSKGKTVNLISDEDFDDKNTIYSVIAKEKSMREDLKSRVERCLSKDSITILDAANYIKGYRYELYCMSKSNFTTQCLVHSLISIDTCRKRNEQSSNKYTPEIFEQLINSYEYPNSTNRWDCPLISVAEGETPWEEVENALLKLPPPPPNMSTQSQPLSSTNFIHQLDRETKNIVKQILDNQKSHGGTLKIADGVNLNLVKPFSPMELRKHQREFMRSRYMMMNINSHKGSNYFRSYSLRHLIVYVGD